VVADKLLGYTATMQGTTLKRMPQVRAKNAVNGRVTMTSSSTQANNDSQSNRSVKVGGTDEDG
jgi:hypothetical protein